MTIDEMDAILRSKDVSQFDLITANLSALNLLLVGKGIITVEELQECVLAWINQNVK